MNHEYSAHEALTLIFASLEQSNPDLAERAQVAIDAGIDDVLEQDVVSGRGRGRKASKREYRKNRPLNDEESIDAVLGVLEAHLVVQRRVVNTVMDDFKEAAIGSVTERSRYETSAKEVVVEVPETVDTVKDVQIELNPESARLTTDHEQTLELTYTRDEEIAEIESLIEVVRTLTRFGN